MATKIVTKNSSTASAVPTASDLVQGELAVNVADKRLFTEDNAGAIVELGTNPYNFTANHNGSAKLATTSTGIDVTGTATMDGLNVDGTITAYGLNFDVSDGVEINALESIVFDIDSDNNQTNRVFQVKANNSTPLFTIQEAGNVGIGTSSPAFDLDILDTSTASNTGAGVNIAHATQPQLRFAQTTGNYRMYVGIRTNDLIIANDSGAEKVRFEQNGNVGIGISSMVNPLHVGVTPNAASKTSGGAFNGGAVRLDGNLANAGDESAILAGSNGSLSAGIGFMRESGATWGTALKFYTHSPAITTTDELTERMRIDASGNVGIGTSSPSNKLHVHNTAGDSFIRMSGGGSLGENYGGFVRGWGVSGSGGNLDLGVIDNNAFRTAINVQSQGNEVRFSTVGSERMRIDSAGNLLVGTTSVITLGKQCIEFDGYSANGLILKTTHTLMGSAYLGFVNSSGAVIGSINQLSTSTVAYNTSSDQRLKENIADADDAGSKIDAIQVRQYDWKADGSHQDYGMIAQELQAVAPEAVSGDADSEEMMGVDYSKLVPMLVKEIQSLRNRVAQLEE